MDKISERSGARPHRARWLALSPNDALAVLLIIVGLVATGALTFFVYSNPYLPLDASILHSVQSYHPAWYDALMRAVSDPGYPPQVYFIVVWILVVLFAFGLKWEAISHAFATVGIGILGLVFKIPIDRPRPDPHQFTVWNPNLQGGRMSYPAGHVESYVAIFGFLIFILIVIGKPSWLRTLEILFFAFLIVAVGVSRVYSGEHWFTDVVAGYLIGLVMLVATILFYRWGRNRFFKEPVEK
ncbi:MAG: phosphatase PAP2 family protein [Rudaea sp.]